MKTITLTILKEDILLDNYMDSGECPITKALRRAGHPNLYDRGYITGQDNNYEEVHIIDNNNESYNDLLKKLYGMYNSLGNDYKHNYELIESIPIETFTHTLIY